MFTTLLVAVGLLIILFLLVEWRAGFVWAQYEAELYGDNWDEQEQWHMRRLYVRLGVIAVIVGLLCWRMFSGGAG